MSYGADPHIVSLQGFTAAQLSTESVSKLLSEEPLNQAGADLEYQLLEASKAGDLELVKKVVLDHPHIVNCRDLDGRHSTPLHFAAGMAPTVLALVNKACRSVYNLKGHGRST